MDGIEEEEPFGINAIFWKICLHGRNDGWIVIQMDGMPFANAKCLFYWIAIKTPFHCAHENQNHVSNCF